MIEKSCYSPLHLLQYMSMGRRLAVRAIIVDETGKLFCVRLKAYGGKAERTFWCTPGGGMDDNESLEDALKREMIEEVNVAPEIGKLLYIQQFTFEGEEQFEFFFEVTNVEDYQDIDASLASHAEEEIAEHGFVDPKTTHILPKFLTEQDIQADIKSSQPTKIFTYL